jgi:hypothetical protein
MENGVFEGMLLFHLQTSKLHNELLKGANLIIVNCHGRRLIEFE